MTRSRQLAMVGATWLVIVACNDTSPKKEDRSKGVSVDVTKDPNGESEDTTIDTPVMVGGMYLACASAGERSSCAVTDKQGQKLDPGSTRWGVFGPQGFVPELKSEPLPRTNAWQQAFAIPHDLPELYVVVAYVVTKDGKRLHGFQHLAEQSAPALLHPFDPGSKNSVTSYVKAFIQTVKDAVFTTWMERVISHQGLDRLSMITNILSWMRGDQSK